MLSGPAPSEVIRYAGFLTVNHGRRVVSTGVDVVDGALEVNSDDDVPEALNVNVPPVLDGMFFPRGQNVTPCWRLLDKSGEVTLVRRAPMLVTGWDKSGHVTAAGLLERVKEDSLAFPSSPRAGARLNDEAQRLIGDSLAVSVEGDNPLLPATLSWGVERMQNLKELCSTYSVQPIVKPDGYLHLVPKIGGSEIVARYTTERDVIDVSDVERREKYNSFTVWANPEDKDKGSIVSATAEVTTGYLRVNSYGRRSLVKELTPGSTYTQCLSEANRLMNEQAISLGTVQVMLLADPRLEIGDVISVKTPSRIVVGRVTKFSLPLTYGEQMRVDLQEVAF